MVLLPEMGVVCVGDSSLPRSNVTPDMVPVPDEAPLLLLQGPDAGNLLILGVADLILRLVVGPELRIPPDLKLLNQCHVSQV